MPLPEPPFVIKQGDLLPTFRVQLLDGLGAPLPIATAAEVRFLMKEQGAATVLINRPATVVDVTEAIVEYIWQTGDTVDPGIYDAEFEVRFGSDQRLTVPNDGYFVVEVTPEQPAGTDPLVSRLRRLVGDRIPPGGSESEAFFTDAELQLLLTENSDVPEQAAYAGWQAKLAEYASLIDIDESGSNRPLSKLFAQAAKMVERYESGAQASLTGVRVVARSAAALGAEPIAGPVDTPWHPEHFSRSDRMGIAGNP